MRLVVLIQVIYLLSNPLPLPVEMIGRVEFWIRVFGELSAKQKLIHHRWFPQCTFGTLDFLVEAELLPPSTLKTIIEENERKFLEDTKSSLIRIQSKLPLVSIFDLRISEVVNQCLLIKRKDIIPWTLKEDLIRIQSGVKEKTREAIKNSGKYLFYIQQVFNSYGIPDDIKYLPILESSFNVNAVSKAGAVGMWQFMPSTGKRYGLVINKYIDERRDPFKSTVAAALYLRDAYAVFKSWPHALISYNHGVEGLRSKLEKYNLGLNLVKLIEDPYQRVLGFASTNFYPSFLAVVYIAKNYKNFFGDLNLAEPFEVEKHYTNQNLSIYSLSQATGVPKEKLVDLNPHLNPAVIQGKLQIPKHTLIYLPKGSRINYSKVPILKTNSKKQQIKK